MPRSPEQPDQRIGTIIQARMGSSRFPGKVLADLCGRPMLARQIERVRGSKLAPNLIIATSTDQPDAAIAELCAREKTPCLRGSLDDVLDRYYQAAVKEKFDVIVRLTADCPIIDPAIIDDVVRDYLASDSDYVSNVTPPVDNTYPDGMDVEVFSFLALERAWKEAKLPSEREHVTFYLWKTGLFKTHRMNLTKNLSHYRLTVDYADDLEVVREVFGALYDQDPLFNLAAIEKLLTERPELIKRNAHHVRHDGWESAFKRDREFRK